jgi:alpha-L-rhamnosidase
MRWILLLSPLALLVAPINARAQLNPTRLRTEYAVRPLGIESTRPRFSWILEPPDSRARVKRQTAYRVQVASTPERLSAGKLDLWDSGVVKSDRQFGVEYAGKTLRSRMRCWWRLKVWDEKGVASAWSRPEWWEMGLLRPEDWKAKWIGAPPPPEPKESPLAESKWVWVLQADVNPAAAAPVGSATFLQTIEVGTNQLRRAEAFVVVDNTCKLYVNGREAGGAAGWQTVTRLGIAHLLRRGLNHLAIVAENGGSDPNPAGIAVKIEVELASGKTITLNLDESWLAAEGDHVASPDSNSIPLDQHKWRKPNAFAPVGALPWGKPKPPKPAEPAPLLLTSFEVSKRVRRARAYVCGLGYHELYINNRKVGDRVLEPAQTDYDRRVLYTTYDVTGCLNREMNTVGVWLGNGWFNQDRVWGGLSYGRPRAVCQIEVTYSDGSKQIVGSDRSWTCARSPVLENNIYAGETFDSRLRGVGPVDLVAAPRGRLVSLTLPPIRRTRQIRPIRITPQSSGRAIYDFGQNFAGWARLNVRAPAGTQIRMRFAEALDAKGDLDTASTGVFATGVEQVDRYICSGRGEETWEPRFTYHGFRYVEVTGLPVAKPENLTGIVVHTDVEPIGSFTCSDPMLNRIHKAALWTERSNLHGIPTDCPARERCGWLGDAQITAEMTHYNWDMSTFWPKYVGDILTSWRGDRPGDVAPGKRGTEPNGHVDWGMAIVFVPYYQYLYTGDERCLREAYPHIVRFVRSVAAMAKDGIIESGNGYGDRFPPGSVEPVETSPALTTTAWLYVAARLASGAAARYGSPNDEIEFGNLSLKTLQAFQRRFYDVRTGSFGSQTTNAMALQLELTALMPRDQVERVAQSLRREVKKHGDHLATGIFGSRYLYDALCSTGNSAAAWKILHQTIYPSHGDLFKKGATTLWECWGEEELDKKWGARSLNHPMQGGFDAWFYQGLAGIRPSPYGPGFRRFLIQPQLMEALQSACASYRSVSGEIRSSWRRTKSGITFDIRIPPNTTATVTLPAANSLTESGRTLTRAKGISEIKKTPANVTMIVASGVYHFSSK